MHSIELERALKYISLLLLLFCNTAIYSQNSLPPQTLLPNDFTQNHERFSVEYLDWEVNNEPSIMCHWYFSSEKDYNVLTMEHFLDSGRYETTYYVDDQLNIQLVREITFQYDKKWDQPNRKVTRKVDIFIFTEPFIRYNERMMPVGNEEENKKLKSTLERNFVEFSRKNKLKT